MNIQVPPGPKHACARLSRLPCRWAAGCTTPSSGRIWPRHQRDLRKWSDSSVRCRKMRWVISQMDWYKLNSQTWTWHNMTIFLPCLPHVFFWQKDHVWGTDVARCSPTPCLTWPWQMPMPCRTMCSKRKIWFIKPGEQEVQSVRPS